MGCLALPYYEQAFPIKSGCCVFLSTAKAAQRCPKGTAKSCAGSYKFGFNGQEKVNEIAGIGNHTTALFWEYDTRIGRRWNLDPKPQISISDYAVNRLNPILLNDPLGDDPLKRAWRHAQKEGLKDNQYSIYQVGKDAYLQRGVTDKEGGGIHLTKFKHNFWDKVGDFFARGERAVGPDGPVQKWAYKFAAEYNPLSQAVTNSWSSILGKDLTIPTYDDALKQGGDVTGDDLSLKRRVTTGVSGATGLVGIGLGGGWGGVTDWGLNAGGDFANQLLNTENAGPGLKYGYNVIKLGSVDRLFCV